MYSSVRSLHARETLLAQGSDVLALVAWSDVVLGKGPERSTPNSFSPPPLGGAGAQDLKAYRLATSPRAWADVFRCKGSVRDRWLRAGRFLVAGSLRAVTVELAARLATNTCWVFVYSLQKKAFPGDATFGNPCGPENGPPTAPRRCLID